jgi:colanic acid/amylovoran biosynthesis glycosyltransferase
VEEGIANVVLEAMQLGTLVLSTDCGGMGEVIKDGVNGFLVPIRNPEAMAAAIQKIQELSREEKEKIIAAAQETIENRYTTTTMVKGMLGLYNQVLEL